MAVRTDLVVAWYLSPRIVTVLAPSTEITIQDLHDTLRFLEDSPEGEGEDILIDSAGKDALGGGVLVGITATLQNAQLAFEERTTPLTDGTATTGNPAGTTLIDTAATFVADGVVRGDVVYNRTDGSLCSVHAVDGETQLTCSVLAGGTANDWEVGDAYSLYRVAQCNVSGGNLVAVDENGDIIDPIYATPHTQIVRTSSSSATLQELEAVQFSSYAGRVAIDPLSPFSGTTFPVGTMQAPVNNLTDALVIAGARGFSDFLLISDMTFSSVDVSGYNFSGVGQRVVLVFGSGVTAVGCRFEELTITGVIPSNPVHIRRCVVFDLTYAGDFLEECSLSGTLTPTGSSAIFLVKCVDADPSLGTTTIDFASYTGVAVAMRDYFGGMLLKNINLPSLQISIDMRGRLLLDSTVVAIGFLGVRGIGHIENSSSVAVGDVDLVPNRIRGAVVADGSNSPSTFKTNLAGPADRWKNALLTFTTGALDDQVRKVAAFNVTTGFVTVSPDGFTGTPAGSDTFELTTR